MLFIIMMLNNKIRQIHIKLLNALIRILLTSLNRNINVSMMMCICFVSIKWMKFNYKDKETV